MKATNSAGASLAYNKPILLLTDEFTTSAAEIFAAIFQDSSRGRSDIRVVHVRAGRRGRALLVSDAGPAGGNAWRPQLGCSGRRLIAVWEDERDGPPQIYSAVANASRIR